MISTVRASSADSVEERIAKLLDCLRDSGVVEQVIGSAAQVEPRGDDPVRRVVDRATRGNLFVVGSTTGTSEY